MDFSWVKELAEQSNTAEKERQAQVRREMLEQKQLALATPPFVEKLHVLLSTCAEEFNKYVAYERLKVVASRVQKRVRAQMHQEDPELSYAEEAASFTVYRKDWVYGVRGSKGTVEFLEIPTTDRGGMSLQLEDVGAAPSLKLTAEIDRGSQKVVWMQDGHPLDGAAIVALCKDYFRNFIERTN